MIAAIFISALLSGGSTDQIDWKHPYGNPVKLVDRGLCVGLAWVKLLPGELATVDYGPDFNVYRVHGPGNTEWGVYSGFAASVAADSKGPLLSKNGVKIYRAVGGNGFEGYLVFEDHPKLSDQNHFFGTMFRGTVADASFFKRALLGPAAKAKCEPTK